jgi:hypothetical protein
MEIKLETMKILINRGFGFGEIGYIAYLSTISGKSIEELAEVVDYDEKGLGNILNELYSNMQ